MNTTYQVPLAVLAGLGVAAGALLFVAGLRGRDPDADPARSLRLTGPMAARLACGLAAGLLILVLTQWVAFAIGACVVVLSWNKLLGGARSQRAALARLEALAAWIESLRDTVATGTALPEALPASAGAANPLITVPLRDLVDRLQSREPLDEALLMFADQLDDVTADEAMAALALNARTQGRQLKAVLSALSSAMRRQLSIRRQVEAERRSTRRASQIIVVITIGMAVGMAMFNPNYVAPYQSVEGQLVLAVVVMLFAAAFWWIRALADFEKPTRFLATPQVRRERSIELAREGRRSAVPRRWLV